MQVVLVMFRTGGERRSFSITRDVTVIGRREDCELRIPVAEVSRKHCRILRDGDVTRLEDLGSSNGTFHNGQRVQSVELQPGDSIQVGPVVFVVQVDGIPADEELQPFTVAKAKSLSDSVAAAGHEEYTAGEGVDALDSGQIAVAEPTLELENADAAVSEGGYALAEESQEAGPADDVQIDFGEEDSKKS